MPEHAYRCDCGQKIHVFFDQSQYPFPETYPCKCGRVLTRFFEGAPGIHPDIWNPYFDQALGCWISSRAERDRIVAKKGLGIMGRDEYTRGLKNYTPKDEIEFTPAEKKLWRESAEKAHADLLAGNVPVPEVPTVDMALEGVSNT